MFSYFLRAGGPRRALNFRVHSTNGLYVGDIPPTQKFCPQRGGVSPDRFPKPDRLQFAVHGSISASSGPHGRSSGFEASLCAGCCYRRSKDIACGEPPAHPNDVFIFFYWCCSRHGWGKSLSRLLTILARCKLTRGYLCIAGSSFVSLPVTRHHNPAGVIL